jgi:serine/threonine-protein kinase PknK
MSDASTAPAGPLRVVVADDDVLLRAGLTSLLGRPGFEVVGEAGDAPTLLEQVREHRPDLVLTDIRMPPTQTVEGLDAARTIREELPEIAVLVLSAHVEVEHAMTLLAGGQGVGYLRGCWTPSPESNRWGSRCLPTSVLEKRSSPSPWV